MGRHIERIFHAHRRRYGYRRIVAQLSEEGHTCSPARVRRIMAQSRLRAIAPRHYVPKTSDGRADFPSPNLLLDAPLPAQVNQVYAGDITFIPTASGWLCLALVIDLCSRRIASASPPPAGSLRLAVSLRSAVGWALAGHLRSQLVIDALQQALGARAKTPNAIFHSDRGSQYGSIAFRALLKQSGLRQSMSARANPYHNAWSERVIGTLKTEMRQGGCFIDQNDAPIEIFADIDSYYNTHRKHSSLGYLSPAQFESNLSQNI